MNPHDAQASLDDIRRLQDRTHEEIVRRNFALPYVVAGALGLFIGFGGIDLERPWNTVALLLGNGLFVVVGIVLQHRASVQMKLTAPSVVFYAMLAAGLIVLFIIFRITAWALFDLPAHGLLSQAGVAGAAVAVTYVAITPLVRRAYRALVQDRLG